MRNEQPYQNFYCHDGCLAAVVGKKQRDDKWALYSMSEVMGKRDDKWALYSMSEVMGIGMAEYEKHILGAYYDEIVGLNRVILDCSILQQTFAISGV